MNKDYKKNLKEELDNIQNRKLELYEKKEELDVFKNPNMFFNYIGNPRLFLERKSLKNKIESESESLDNIYESLRKQYRNYFSQFDNPILIAKQEKIGCRLEDLDKRYRKVRSLKKNNLLFKISDQNRRINRVLRKICNEKTKQKKFLEDTLEEIWKRGICLEVYYTQKGFGSMN